MKRTKEGREVIVQRTERRPAQGSAKEVGCLKQDLVVMALNAAQRGWEILKSWEGRRVLMPLGESHFNGPKTGKPRERTKEGHET